MIKDRHPAAANIAEGATVPALPWAVRRVDVSRSKVEVVSARHSSATSISRRGARRPVVAPLASVPESTSRYSQIDVPAAH